MKYMFFLSQAHRGESVRAIGRRWWYHADSRIADPSLTTPHIWEECYANQGRRPDPRVHGCVGTSVMRRGHQRVDGALCAGDRHVRRQATIANPGRDAYRKNFEAWFASVQGPIDYEIRDLRITMSDDVAFCHYVAQVKSTRTTGEKADYSVRVTSGFQKTNGQWMVRHEHVSVPFDG